MARFQHLERNCPGTVFHDCDVTGVWYDYCSYCRAMQHDPVKFQDAGYTGWYQRIGLFADDPNGCCVTHLQETPKSAPRMPVLKAPVTLAFDPMESVAKDDAGQHEGVSFARLWADPVARAIWLGYKPFMLTSQHFRARCVADANYIRKHPDYLLGERVSFGLDFMCIFPSEEHYALGAQLVPHLIWALKQEGRWPYFAPRGLSELGWRTVANA